VVGYYGKENVKCVLFDNNFKILSIKQNYTAKSAHNIANANTATRCCAANAD
jgi:hypothetical protein